MVTIGSFTLTEEEVAKRKSYLEITAEDETRLRQAHPHLQVYAPEIADRFYNYLLAHPHTREILSPPGLLDRLKVLQARYFDELTSGVYDIAYFENRLRVGQAHERVGLSPEWYLGAYNKYLQSVSDVLSRAFGRDYERYFQTMISLTKIVYLDMSLALDAYILTAQARLAEQNAALVRSNQELKRVQAAKQQLSDMIVHDLQNPLAGIMAFLELLREKGGLTDSESGALEEALRRCNDLVNMILNVLQVSRGEEGKLDTLLEEIDVADVARQSANAFHIVAELDGRMIGVEAVSPVPAVADEKLLRRILYNLIRNALRHTPKGTRVLIKVEETGPAGARISVIDDGPGVPLQVQPLLFERFGSAALRNAGLRVDSGLGLAFCKTAAEAIGASLTVESDGRHGTSFTILLGGSQGISSGESLKGGSLP
jgi:signal transduction histidine kinase